MTLTTSETVAVAAAILFLVTLWYKMSKYFYSNDERDNAHLFHYTFHVETLRLIGFSSFIVVLLNGALLTNKLGKYFDTVPDPTTTVIYKIFGFNHSCNVIDHNPSKMISAMLLTPLCQLPLMMYCLLWHVRLAKEYRAGLLPGAEQKISKGLLNTSRILTPYNFITMSQLHLWFVNGPEESYGFIAHYVPYFMFQLAIIFMMLLNVAYLIHMDTLPFGQIIKPRMAWAYIIFVAAVTVICMIFVISTLADPENPMFRHLVHDYLSNIWIGCALVGTFFFSIVERKDGNDITLSVSDGRVAIANADGSGTYGSIP